MNSTRWMTRNGTLLGLLLLAAVLVLPGLGRLAMSREPELRVACAARDMAKGGSWLLPRYMGELRLKKPPLMYWIVAAAMKSSGAERSPSVARLPSALFAIALIGLIYLAGAPLMGRRRAAAGALAAACSFLFLRFGRLGETDMPLAFFTTASVLFLWQALERPRGYGAWLAAGICAGLGFMIKGPAAIVLPLVTAIGYLAVNRPARQRLRPAGPALAFAIFALLVAPWYLYIFFSPEARAAAGAEVQGELLALVEKTRHAEPMVYYLYTLPFVLLPLGLLLFPAVYVAVRGFRHHARIRFLLVWLALPMLAMSLIKSKQFHYATLLMPQACLLIGLLIGRTSKRPPWPSHWTSRYLNGGFVLCALAGLGLVFSALRYPVPHGWVAIIGGLGLSTLAMAAFRRRSHATSRNLPRLAALAGLFAVMAPLFLYGMAGMTNGHEAIPEFAERIEATARQAPRVFFVGDHANTFVFYLERDVKSCNTFTEAWNQMRAGDVVIVSNEKKHRAEHWPLRDLQPEYEKVGRNIELALFMRPAKLP